jgi:hypothetical protein
MLDMVTKAMPTPDDSTLIIITSGVGYKVRIPLLQTTKCQVYLHKREVLILRLGLRRISPSFRIMYTNAT